MSSKVVRFVGFPENTTDEWLKMYIQQRVLMEGQIKQIYIRKCDEVDLNFSYVIFESSNDAQQTVTRFNDTLFETKTLDVALIGPGENYNMYTRKMQFKKLLEKQQLELPQRSLPQQRQQIQIPLLWRLRNRIRR